MDLGRFGRGDPFMVKYGSWIDLEGGGRGTFGVGCDADIEQIGQG